MYSCRTIFHKVIAVYWQSFFGTDVIMPIHPVSSILVFAWLNTFLFSVVTTYSIFPVLSFRQGTSLHHRGGLSYAKVVATTKDNIADNVVVTWYTNIFANNDGNQLDTSCKLKYFFSSVSELKTGVGKHPKRRRIILFVSSRLNKQEYVLHILIQTCPIYHNAAVCLYTLTYFSILFLGISIMKLSLAVVSMMLVTCQCQVEEHPMVLACLHECYACVKTYGKLVFNGKLCADNCALTSGQSLDTKCGRPTKRTCRKSLPIAARTRLCSNRCGPGFKHDMDIQACILSCLVSSQQAVVCWRTKM